MRRRATSQKGPVRGGRKCAATALAIVVAICDKWGMRKNATPDDKLSAVLRQAIRDSEESFYMLAKVSGVARMSLVRFANGERSLRLDRAGNLAAYFGLELVKRKG